MEKAMIFKHNLPYDVNVHPVAEDTITLVPRFENQQVRDLYIDFHLQGYKISELGVALWKQDLEKMPARGLVYKNAKEISFMIDIVDYNEDVLNRNFAVTKTESGNYKFWWIKKIERVGQLKATLYQVTLTLDYWWTYGIDELFDHDKQVLIKRAHVRGYELIDGIYRELNNIWSNPLINAGEEFTPNEANYIIEDFDLLNTPFAITNNGDIEYTKDDFFSDLSNALKNNSEIGVYVPEGVLSDTLMNTGLDIYYYWSNSIEKKPTLDCLDLSFYPSEGSIARVTSVYNYQYIPSNESFQTFGWGTNEKAVPYFSQYFWLPPFTVLTDPQKITGSSSRLNLNLPYIYIGGDTILNFHTKTWDSYVEYYFQSSGKKLYLSQWEQINLYQCGYSLTGEGTPAAYYYVYMVDSEAWNYQTYLRFDKFFKHYSYNNIDSSNFDISKQRMLDEVKLHNDPYTKYRIIMPSKNQFDIMPQFVNDKIPLGFKHITILDPGQPASIILPFQYQLNKEPYFYGLSNNYNLSLDDNTNFTWPDSSNAYDNYMLQNKSRLHQNQVDKYVHASFKMAEDAAGGIGDIFSGNWGGAASSGIKVAEDAYSIYQIHADYAAHMQDLKRTPGKWESKSNNLLATKTYKAFVPIMYKLTLSEPIKTITANLFIAHGYNIGAYRAIYPFINGKHERYYFNYVQASNCINIIQKELSLGIKMAIQADLASGIQIRHIRSSMLKWNGDWKYMNKFNDFKVNNVENNLAIIPNENN